MRLRRRLANERHPDNELSLGAMAVLGCLYRNGELSERGRETLLADRARRDAWLARKLKDLTAEERAVLRRAAPILEELAQKD
jgi:DNA-binding MarR family transcriptional regulator